MMRRVFTKMHCVCEELPEYTYYHSDHGLSQKLKPFIKSVEKKNWEELFRCDQCGTYWRIAIADRLQIQFVWKVGEYREDWAEARFAEKEKQLLLQCRGGEINEPCMWAGCDKPKVKGSAYCVDHLHASGWRR
jgi:hypothetical protein